MSDTPITDSYQNCYDGRFLPAMEKLERENAALRALLLRTADALESEIEADERKGTWHNHAALAAAWKEAQP